MPGDDRLRLDDKQRLTPPGPQSGEHDPVQAIGGLELAAALPEPALKNQDLVAEREELSLQVGATPTEISDRGAQDDQNPDHAANLAQSASQEKCLSIQYVRNFREAQVHTSVTEFRSVSNRGARK